MSGIYLYVQKPLNISYDIKICMGKKSRSVFIKRLKLQRVVNKKVDDRVYYGYKISFGETVLLNGFEWSGVRYVDLYRRDDGKVILVPIRGCDLEFSEDAE